MNKTISIILIATLILGIFSLASCKSKTDGSPAAETSENIADVATAQALTECGIIHEPEFGGVYIKNTIEEFNALGYEYGDSVDVEFSNGYKLTGIPYYNGYYTQNGEPLLIAYPGYDYIKAAINNGDDLFEVAGLDENMTASVSLNKRGGFLSIQNARDIHYTDNRDDYGSDVIFANFRAVDCTAVKKNTLFRSASPCDNQHNRATYVNSLLGEYGIRFILNLSDNDDKIAGYMSKEDFSCDNFEELYNDGKVIPIALNMNFSSAEFKEKIVIGLNSMADSDGPYLVHCTEGKDRTGFVCMLLEALAGATYDEIEKDYMITYDNYYGITPEKDSERYTVIVENVLQPMIKSMTGKDGVDIKSADLSVYAREFLKSGGMTDEEITTLRNNISE